MWERLLQFLACPNCHTDLECRADEVADNGEILTGSLTCTQCKEQYPVVRAIPRFVPARNYADSFGYQWNRFRSLQIDAENQTQISRDRFLNDTGWTLDSMAGKWIVDMGCGAGRFLEIASRSAAEVVGLDLSNAVDAARKTCAGRRNVHFVQASIFAPPFRKGSFDACYCIGVLQHTPDPPRAMASLPQLLKPSGQIAITMYERRRWTLWNAKYIIRHATRHLPDRVLMYLLAAVMPLVGRFFKFTIPIANYVDIPELTLSNRYRCALLDTFDMLAPYYDSPMSQPEAEAVLSSQGIVTQRRLSPGLTLVGDKLP